MSLAVDILSEHAITVYCSMPAGGTNPSGAGVTPSDASTTRQNQGGVEVGLLQAEAIDEKGGRQKRQSHKLREFREAKYERLRTPGLRDNYGGSHRQPQPENGREICSCGGSSDQKFSEA
eukprot:2962141-Pyramimonas_sp.AAC.1